MSKMPEQSGLYRTILPMTDRPAEVPARTLVHFVSPEDGGPKVQLPNKAENNRWTFLERGHEVTDEQWAATLVPLNEEGFYRLTQDLWIGGGQKMPKGLLVQLGYTKEGQAAAFPGKVVDTNKIEFQRRGALISDLQADSLLKADFKVVATETKRAGESESTH